MTYEFEQEEAEFVAEERQQYTVDFLTGQERPTTDKETITQRMIKVLAGEYHFPLATMGRDIKVSVEVDGRRRNKTADLVIFEPGAAHELMHAIRIIVVQPPSTKPADASRGVGLLKDLLHAVDGCEFGLWTNGRDVAYFQKKFGLLQSEFVELSDFPGNGESLEDLDRQDRRVARVAVAEDLRETILRCHDYLYGNQSMRADRAFAEMLKLIFCKIHDERQLRASTRYRRQFWVGVTERNTPEGQHEIAERIKTLFGHVKHAQDIGDAFRPADEIELEPRHLAWVAGELARYQFLDAEVDIKGMAYEAMVATIMKRERGQFFTPRNIVDAMVEILAPQPHERVLDPACGSGRFLVSCLDRFRQQRAIELARPGASASQLRALRNSGRILGEAAEYARKCLFGIDVDPELQRVAKMNMLINNDGHGNLLCANSLELTRSDIARRTFPGAEHLDFETFDIVLTNPPFGSRIPVNDPAVLRGLALGCRWQQLESGDWAPMSDLPRAKMPPEILFIGRCLDWLKPGGRMGIVLPDGILGNPDNEPIRFWILQHARVLASIDLPVETFLPQVGVQASLLFLEKKSVAEVNAGAKADYPIFMAVAEVVGHDRRGNPTYRRDPDGFDLWESYTEEFSILRDGVEALEARQTRRRQPADDIPLIAQACRHWMETGVLPSLT